MAPDVQVVPPEAHGPQFCFLQHQTFS